MKAAILSVKTGVKTGFRKVRFLSSLAACIAVGTLELSWFNVSLQAFEIPASQPDAAHQALNHTIQIADDQHSPVHSPLEAFENGRLAYHSGRKSEAISALQFAAEQGHTGAQWMLGRMYAEGDGVVHDDQKAFEYFKGIVELSSVDPDSYEVHQNAPYVSSALVWLGSYYLEGIAGTHIKPQPERALRLFVDAAYNFGDPNAQYDLARMYLDGNGVAKDPAQAVKWLNLAAQKKHAPSQALLGHMLFMGQAVPRQPAKGLSLMALARKQVEENPDATSRWIIELHNKALEQTSQEDREQSIINLERWLNVER
jgi:uncharacterized protein